MWVSGYMDIGIVGSWVFQVWLLFLGLVDLGVLAVFAGVCWVRVGCEMEMVLKMKMKMMMKNG